MKNFVLDTNVLLHNANAIMSFSDNEVVIPLEVIEELDRFKTHNDDLGRNARHVIRTLDRLRVKGTLSKGVDLGETGGTLRIPFNTKDDLAILNKEVPDNRIIAVAYCMMKEGKSVVFVSKDINARIKADALGIVTMDFEKEKVDSGNLYMGWREIEVNSEVIDSFSKDGHWTPDESLKLLANEYVHMRDKENKKHTAIGRYDQNKGKLYHFSKGRNQVFGIEPRNMQQAMAIDMLLVDDIKMNTLIGQAGTGKTLIALAAGLHKVMVEKTYEKLLVSRPIMPLGKDIGYLPGSKDEKLANWMGPIFDNLRFLMRKQGDAERRIQTMMDDGILELEALTYIRGRSIPHQFLIVDEAQNLTPHEIKTILSRAGEGTKVILTGDAQQIDNPYLDSSSNGLSYAVERMKDNSIHGHITLERSERSELASLAAKLL